MDSFCIPWPCVDTLSKPSEPEKNLPKPPKSFAQAVTNVCEIPLSQLPQACVKGDRLAIAIPESDYNAGLEACKHNLHGRIIWPKGATPSTVADLKNKLSTLWKDLSKWGVSSLGKGYYEFVFSTLEDVRRVRSIASWNLNPGLLKLFAWSKDFNPRVQQNNSAQVWVRFYGLSQEYWRPNIIFAIASSIGTPICIDSFTAKPMLERTFGQFVRVLVDMDLSQTLRDKVLVERIGFAFFVDIDYENLPHFCTNCKMIGHHIGICKKLSFVTDENIDKEAKDRKKQVKEPTKVYAPETDVRVGIDKEKEIINVESDKVESAVQVNNPAEEKSKNNATVNLETVSVKSKPAKTNSNKSLQQNNRFSLLVDNPDEGSITSKQQPLQKSIEQQNMHSKSSDKGKAAAQVSSPDTVFKEQDKLLEAELVADSLQNVDVSDDVNGVDDVSSQGSYIDATQELHDKSSDESDKNVQGTSSATPEKVKKDMAFLNESWANMVDNDDEEARLMQFLEKAPSQPVENFQVQLSKGQKRTQKKLNQSSKDSYQTRSKVSLKPFK
jgi:hypothetical protein